MVAVEIREVEERDLPGVMRVLAESGIDLGRSFTIEEAKQHFAKLRQSPGYRLFAALVEDEIVGTYSLVLVGKLGKRGTPAGLVEDVAVMPAVQGRGIGRRMMEHALEECRRAGCYK